MNSVIFPQLIKSLISDLLCCFWEDVLWLLRKRWLMCLFVCCSLENCLSGVSFSFSQGFSGSWLQSLPKLGKGEAGSRGKGLSLQLSGVQTSPCTAFFMLGTQDASSLSTADGRETTGLHWSQSPTCFLASFLIGCPYASEGGILWEVMINLE